jgi:4-amino-4-deoxy-L-arabinose transferase-like glycosyltransferase
VRSVPALFGLAGVLFAYAAGRLLYGRMAGLVSAVILGTSLLYFALSRILILDMVVSVFMAAALFCFILGVREKPGARRRLLFYGLYACAALATLAKGLIGLMLPGAVMFLWLLVFNQWKRLLPFYLFTGAALFLAIAAPWHILAAQRNEDWAWFYFIREHWLRFTTSTHSRYQPWWFFVPIVVLGFAPWTGYAWTAIKESLPGAWSRRKAEADTWFLVLWAVFIFFFFSRSQSKLIPYILPLFPAIAVLLGAWITRVLDAGSIKRMRAGLVFHAGFGIVLGLAIAVLCIKPMLIRDGDLIETARPLAIATSIVLLAGAVIPWWVARLRGARAAFLAQALSFAAFFVCTAILYPAFQHRVTKDLAEQFNARAGASDLVYHYRCFAHDFLFYTGRLAGTVSHADELELELIPETERKQRFIEEAEFRRQWEGDRRVWIVARRSEAERLFADSSFRYHLIASNRLYTLLSNRP